MPSFLRTETARGLRAAWRRSRSASMALDGSAAGHARVTMRLTRPLNSSKPPKPASMIESSRSLSPALKHCACEGGGRQTLAPGEA